MDKINQLIKLYTKITGDSIPGISTYSKNLKYDRDKATKK